MVFVVNLARVVFAPLIQPAAADFGVSVASLGIVTTAAWLGSAAGRLPTGYLLTRFRRHQLIIASGAVLVVAALFASVTRSVTGLTIGAFLMGLSSGIYLIAANPLISELFPHGVGRAVGIHGMSLQIAAAAAPLIVSGVLLVGNWRRTFTLIAIITAGVTVALVVVATRTDLPNAGTDDTSLFAAGRSQWPMLVTVIALVGVTAFLWNGLFNLYGDYLEVAKDIGPGSGRLLLSLMFAAGIPGFLLTGRLADRVPNMPLICGIIGSFTLSVVGLTLAESLLVIAAMSLVMGYTIHSLFAATDRFLLFSLPDENRASAYAIYSTIMMFIQALGPVSVGQLVTNGVSYGQTFQLLAIAVGLVLGSVLVLYRTGSLPT